MKDRRPRDPEAWIRPGIEKYRKGRWATEFRPDADFFALADEVVAAGRTLLGYDRLYGLWQAMRNVANVPGAAAEIGSFRGGSAFFLAAGLEAMAGEEVALHVFDTFEGHPSAALTTQDGNHAAGQFGETSFDEVSGYLSRFARTLIHRGDVLLTLPDLDEAPFRLVHIDTDLYLPTKTCLEYFGARLQPGAVVVLDDYSSDKCPGVRAALVEYLERHDDDYHVWDVRTEQLILARR